MASFMCMLEGVFIETYRSTLEPHDEGQIAGGTGNHFFAVIQPPKHVRPCKELAVRKILK